MNVTIVNVNSTKIKNEDILKWLDENVFIPVPSEVNSVEDLTIIQECMTRYTNQYSYLVSLKSQLKLGIRFARKEKYSKEDIDILVDRKAIIEDAMSVVKIQLQTVSRLITIKQEINRELQINNNR